MRHLLAPPSSNDWGEGGDGGVCLRSGCTRRRSVVFKKCLKEDGVQLQESKVTDEKEKEKEGGARHLSLECSVPPIARQREVQFGEGRGWCAEGHG